MPHSPYSPDLGLSDFIFPPMKKVPKGNQKMVEALKGTKIGKFKNWFEQWKRASIGVLHQMENTLKVTEVETCNF